MSRLPKWLRVTLTIVAVPFCLLYILSAPLYWAGYLIYGLFVLAPKALLWSHSPAHISGGTDAGWVEEWKGVFHRCAPGCPLYKEVYDELPAD